MFDVSVAYRQQRLFILSTRELSLQAAGVVPSASPASYLGISATTPLTITDPGARIGLASVLHTWG
jgi:hypothetical protein